MEFDKEALLTLCRQEPLVKFRTVSYLEITKAKKRGIAVDELPFYKRVAFRDEKEFRMIYINTEEEHLLRHVLPK